MINPKVDFENPETEIKCEFGKAIRENQLINWFVSQPAFIQALCPDFGWEV